MALKACVDIRFYFTHYQDTPSWTRKIVEASRQQSSHAVSSTVTITELISLMMPDVGLDAVRIRIQSAKDAAIEFISPSEAISHQAGEILLKDRSLPIADAIVEATALAHTEAGCTLMTPTSRR